MEKLFEKPSNAEGAKDAEEASAAPASSAFKKLSRSRHQVPSLNDAR
jgi:hypothetical protein